MLGPIIINIDPVTTIGTSAFQSSASSTANRAANAAYGGAAIAEIAPGSTYTNIAQGASISLNGIGTLGITSFASNATSGTSSVVNAAFAGSGVALIGLGSTGSDTAGSFIASFNTVADIGMQAYYSQATTSVSTGTALNVAFSGIDLPTPPNVRAPITLQFIEVKEIDDNAFEASVTGLNATLRVWDTLKEVDFLNAPGYPKQSNSITPITPVYMVNDVFLLLKNGVPQPKSWATLTDPNAPFNNTGFSTGATGVAYSNIRYFRTSINPDTFRGARQHSSFHPLLYLKLQRSKSSTIF